MEHIGVYAVPVIIVSIVLFGMWWKTALFDSFTEGVKEGFSSLLAIAPSLIGLIIGVTMLEASGFFALIAEWMAPVCRWCGIPAEVVPLGLMRPVTGSGSFALLNTLLEQHGADSFIGRAASVMAGSTETTFYAITVYYGAVGLKRTGYTVPAALLADLTGMLLAVGMVRWLS